jgi:hypothetical protein
MTPRGKDKWQSLPDVVAQLQAEAANPAISRPRIAWPDEPIRAGADDARPTVHGHREHERGPRPAAAAAVPPAGARRDPATEPPANEQIDWGGLCDYDRLATDPRPDLRALGLLLVDACQRSCGARHRSIERLLGDLNRRIDKLLVDPDAAGRRAQRQALCKLLDRIEDLLVPLMVNP